MHPSYPLMSRLCSTLLNNKMLGNLVARMVLNGDDRWWAIGEVLSERCFRSKGGQMESFDRSVEGYVRFCYDMFKEQSAFTAKGAYSHDDWDLVNELVYTQEEVMEGYYLDGILFSTILWPNHYRMYREIFLDQFLSRLSNPVRALEVGVGPGQLFSEMLSRSSSVHMTGVDISEFSLAYASRMARAVDPTGTRFRMVSHNVNGGLPDEGEGHYDAIILGEVVEHLSNPFPLMHDCYARLRDDGALYFSTAINAASVDHIFLIRTVREVHEMLRACSFEVVDELPLRAEGAPLIKNPNGGEWVPINYACVARKSSNA